MPTDIEPNDIPTPVLEQGWEHDTASAREFENWDQLDKLSRQKRENQLAFHKALGWCIPAAIIAAFVGLLISAVVYLAHVLGPPTARWLTADEVQHLHSMLFSGIVGAALAEAVRHYMKKDDPPQK